jgi:hypothetical protein
MLRSLLIIAAAASLTAQAAAQTRPIQWLSNINQGIGQAKRAGLPIMFYVSGSGRDDGDIGDAQQVTFRDPLVGEIARERFVAVRLARSTQTKELLAQLGTPTEYGNYIVFVTPEMKLLGQVQPGQVADARVMAQQMTMAFRKFRTELFERDIKPILEDKEAKPANLTKALKHIQKLLITEADTSVVQFVKERELSNTVRKQAYDALAKLSTQNCAKALLEAALNDKLAEKALGRCEDGVADALIPSLDAENFNEFVIAYESLVKICGLKGKKSRGFWNGKNQRLIDEELDRVEQAARAAAQNWRQRYEPYR